MEAKRDPCVVLGMWARGCVVKHGGRETLQGQGSESPSSAQEDAQWLKCSGASGAARSQLQKKHPLMPTSPVMGFP